MLDEGKVDLTARVEVLERGHEVLERGQDALREEYAKISRVAPNREKVLNAIRDTQAEHGLAIARLDAKVAGLDAKLDAFQEEVRGAFLKVAVGFAGIEGSLQYVIDHLPKEPGPSPAS